MFVDWLDDKYDLGYLDEILGGDDVEKQEKSVSKPVCFQDVNHFIIQISLFLFVLFVVSKSRN